jgi:EAL domain-containing protein (putative c-di-GMP-specific phosphodiesterase class I)
VPPAEFIPLAEEGDLILEIGEWVLREVCKQSQAWRAEGFESLPIAVNLSRRQIGQSALLAKVGEFLSEAGLQPADLEFEVTESAILHDEDAAVRTLRALKQMGSTLSLDDFGTGYSSLTYLRRFPIDVLKIDRSFVKNVAHDPDDAAIVAATIAMARSLKLTVVAEGVETDEQEVFLYATGCDQLQGFRISPPLPAQDCVGFLPRRKGEGGLRVR